MKKIIILIFILAVGLSFRLFYLDTRPLGFTWDEAALGYNAYSLLKTGADEHQTILPIVFKSFGDYKPGLYVYLTVPSVAIFGLNEFAVRLPSALMGGILIVAIYLWTKNLWIASLLALNPWALHFSRGAWEANVSLTLIVLGVVLLIKQRWVLAATILGLTFWTYQGAKMFTPLILFSYWFVYRPKLKLIIKSFWPLVIFLLPLLWNFSAQSGRLRVFSVFSYTRMSQTVQEIVRQDAGNKLWQILFHTEILDQTRGIVQRFLNHFSPRYLFFEGDWSSARHSLTYHGYFYIFEVVTILIGLTISRNKFLVLWAFFAVLPSALSRDIVSGVRSLPLVIPLVILSGLGLEKIAKNKLLLCALCLLSLCAFIRYLDLYYVHNHKFAASHWSYAYKPALQIVLREQEKYKHIVFTHKLGQPYIYLLFYGMINPREFQGRQVVQDNTMGDVGEVTSFGKYEFRDIYWPKDRGLPSTLFVGDEFSLPETDLQVSPNLIRVGEVNYPNGDSALKLIGTL